MKTLAILFYVIGGILLIVSCFTTSVAATWWVGGISVVFLIAGCICQYNDAKHRDIYHRY